MRRATLTVLGVASILALHGCKSRAEAEKKTAAQAASALVDDISPLDSASAQPFAAQQEPWDPASCEVLPEPDKSASFSDLTFTGTCMFHHRGPATCRARGDDYYIILRRKLADGSDAEVYINVEFYTGPGTYEKKTEILFLVRRGQSLYRWSTTDATMTLGFGEGGISSTSRYAEQAQAGTPTTAQIPKTELVAAPGTKTSGAIQMSGTIKCIILPPPGR